MTLSAVKPWLAVAAVATAIAASAAGPAPAWGAGHPLSLDEAIGSALAKNEGIVVSRESAAAAKATVGGAHGVYNPVLSLDGGWRRSKTPVNSAFSGAPAGEGAPTAKDVEATATLSQYLPTGATLSLHATSGRGTTNGTFDLLSPVYQTQVGVELRQPLLRNLLHDPERLSIRVADAEHKRSAAALRVQVTETVAAVEKAYWNLVAARASVGVREEAVRLAHEQLSETEERVQSGDVPETEAAQPRAEVERRRGELLAARESAEHAETALKLLILGDSDADLWPVTFVPQADSTIDTTAVDREAAMEQALRSRPELAVAAATLERRKAESAFATSGTRPKLEAVVTFDRYGMSGTSNPAANLSGFTTNVPDYTGDWGKSWSMIGNRDFADVFAGLEFSIPIGNDAAQGDEAVARHAERIAEADITHARKLVRAQVLDAAAAVETAGQRIEAARAGREAAQVQLSAEKDRYDVGLSTNFLVLTRQNDLSNAELNEISARTDYRIARTELARATGALLEEHHISVDDTAH